MAFNPSLKVAACRDIASKFGADEVVILMIHNNKGTIEYDSYGKTRELCDHAKTLADAAFHACVETYK